MTYASIILPDDLKLFKVNENPKTTQSIKGKLISAMKKGGAAVENAIQNPGATFQTLGEYLQDNEDKILNKFSGIALAQMLATGKVTNQEALDYLFLGFAPALDQQAVAMGYSGAMQMKEAIANGSINVGSFISGFSKVQKNVVDFKNSQKNKAIQKSNNIIELDVTFNYNEQYQSESPDRRVENGVSYQEVLHNLPEIFSLECGFSELKGRYTLTEFKGYLIQLRESKKVFKMVIGDSDLLNVTLQDFRPSVSGARSGLDYTLDLKKIHIGSVELTQITIEPLDVSLYKQDEKNVARGAGIVLPDYLSNPANEDTKNNKKNNMGMVKTFITEVANIFHWGL